MDKVYSVGALPFCREEVVVGRCLACSCVMFVLIEKI